MLATGLLSIGHSISYNLCTLFLRKFKFSFVCFCNRNSSFDIAFSLNCEQPSMAAGPGSLGTGCQNSPVQVRISSTPTTSPLLGHKPHPSQAGETETLSHLNGKESTSLNASYQATDAVTGDGSGQQEESLIDHLFFIH